MFKKHLSLICIILIGYSTALSKNHNFNPEIQHKLNLLTFNNTLYVDLYEFIELHKMHSKYYETKDKIEISFYNHRIYLSPYLSFIKINDEIYHLSHPVLYKNNNIFIPVYAFYESLKNANLPHRIIKKGKKHYICCA